MYCTQLPAMLWHGHAEPVVRLALNTGKNVTIASKDHKGALAGTLAVTWTWTYLQAHQPTAARKIPFSGALCLQYSASLAGISLSAAPEANTVKGFVVVDECCSGGCGAGPQAWQQGGSSRGQTCSMDSCA